MKPEAKAEELIRYFQKVLYIGGAGHESTVSYNDIKQCALIAAKEIVNQIKEIRKPENTSFWNPEQQGSIIDGYEYIDFWKKVIKELER